MDILKRQTFPVLNRQWRIALRRLAAIIVLAASAAIAGASTSQPSRLKVAAEGDGNSVTVSDDGEAVIVEVRSRGGIGRATAKFGSGALPQKIILRLHVKGLEEFRLSYGQTALIVRVSSSNPSITQSLVLPNGDEQPIPSTSPSRLAVRIVSDQAKPRIPLDHGHFEITFPKHYLREGSRDFSVQWIDFFR